MNLARGSHLIGDNFSPGNVGFGAAATSQGFGIHDLEVLLVIGDQVNGEVVDNENRANDLSDLFEGRFPFSRLCNDVADGI